MPARQPALTLAAGLMALVTSVSAQAPVDPQTLGPKVGETVPDFSLQDQHGMPRSLGSLMGPKGAVLVFYRSADW